MIKIAAAGDMHFDKNSHGRLSHHLSTLPGQADLLLLAGDLTQHGLLEEGMILAHDLRTSPVPVVAVLGNHDYNLGQERGITDVLRQAGVHVLEQTSVSLRVGSFSVGIAGVKGFGGGFVGACGTDYGEPEMKMFIRHTKVLAKSLKENLDALDTDCRIVLMHYSPVSDTLVGEPKEIYPFLGSYLFAEAIDEAGADLAFHGHAHRGTEKGTTMGGIPVRNVAQPVIRHAVNIYSLTGQGISAQAEAVRTLGS